MNKSSLLLEVTMALSQYGKFHKKHKQQRMEVQILLQQPFILSLATPLIIQKCWNQIALKELRFSVFILKFHMKKEKKVKMRDILLSEEIQKRFKFIKQKLENISVQWQVIKTQLLAQLKTDISCLLVVMTCLSVFGIPEIGNYWDQEEAKRKELKQLDLCMVTKLVSNF